eukprot:scaffold3297_cov327-Prasinococcus_capsulatus_cf.AAC.1
MPYNGEISDRGGRATRPRGYIREYLLPRGAVHAGGNVWHDKGNGGHGLGCDDPRIISSSSSSSSSTLVRCAGRAMRCRKEERERERGLARGGRAASR